VEPGADDGYLIGLRECCRGMRNTGRSAANPVPAQGDRWLKTVPRDEAFWERDMFANQNTACQLSHRRTIERVTQQLQIGEG